jgi:transcriptional regulator with XRE-family HTH domain
MDLSNKIKAIREAKNIKQVDVAKALDLDPSYYYRLEKERGNKLTIGQLEKIAGALGVSVIELLTGEAQKMADSEEVERLRKRVEELEEMVELLKDRMEQKEKEIKDLEGKESETIQFKNEGLSETKKMIERAFETSDLVALLASPLMTDEMKKKIRVSYQSVIGVLEAYINTKNQLEFANLLLGDDKNRLHNLFKMIVEKDGLEATLDKLRKLQSK